MIVYMVKDGSIILMIMQTTDERNPMEGQMNLFGGANSDNFQNVLGEATRDKNRDKIGRDKVSFGIEIQR